ncbi:hypothetical protein Emed_006034 [Eimeria media]
MVALDAVKAEGPPSTGAGGAPHDAQHSRQPIASLLQQIYETKILSRLFGSHEGGGPPGPPAPASSSADSTTKEEEGGPQGGPQRGPKGGSLQEGPLLCACARAALAADLLRSVEGRTLQVADLPGGVEAGLNNNNPVKEAAAAAAAASAAAAAASFECSLMSSVPLGLRALIKLLQERLGGGGLGFEGGERREKVEVF